ncbi:MAG: acetamidase/formamidase family protein [Negativicutes bacterium]|nr:acetamidase/formamidase family protein [Negativicutes bacterium]
MARPQSTTKTVTLPAMPETTYTGYFDNSQPPVLAIDSGDTVSLETMGLLDGDLAPGLTLDKLLQLRQKYAAENRTGHTLTGPIYVNGAEPGDVLEVRIIKLIPGPYAVNYTIPGTVASFGTLPEDFPEGQVKDFALDLERMTTAFSDDIEIPLRPFLGVMAVAPAAPGRLSTAPPREFGGNIDCKELVAGSTLYLPVFVEGALFSAGDAHAAQGDGEVCITALETPLDECVLQFVVRKDMKLFRPMAETPSHWITFGFHPELEEAAKTALRDMIDFLVAAKGLTRLDAYSLCSIAADLRVTQLVDGNKGIHAMLAKSIFKR